MNGTYELIILGGGAMGLSTAYNAVSPYGDHPVLDGEKVLVLEQYEFFNQKGSTAGASRQFRVQYSQDYLSSLAVAAQPEWRLLQEQAKTQLVGRGGSLWFGDPSIPTQEGGIAPALETMDKVGIPYTKLDARQLNDQYGFRDLPKKYIGFFQAAGGIINVPATLRTMLETANRRGVDLRYDQKVLNIHAGKDLVTVTTAAGELKAKKLVITPGPFANEVLAHLNLKLNLQIWEMVSAYFRKNSPDVNYPTWFAFQEGAAGKKFNENLYYGFPEAAWQNPGYIRVAPDYPYRTVTRAEDRQEPVPADFQGTIEWVRQHMPGLQPEPKFEATCLIALPNGGKELILDYAPGNKNIVIYTGGWAAKFIPLIGKIWRKMALTGKTQYNVSKFRIDRPNMLIR